MPKDVERRERGVPALDHFAQAQRELEKPGAFARGVELGTVVGARPHLVEWEKPSDFEKSDAFPKRDPTPGL